MSDDSGRMDLQCSELEIQCASTVRVVHKDKEIEQVILLVILTIINVKLRLGKLKAAVLSH